jgi:DNA invertase Pin-like site-specific DNA recombinase
MLNADSFQLHLYAALAEQGREFISTRTKAALAVAKLNGVKLGGLRDKTGERNKVRKQNAIDCAGSILGVLEPMAKHGY